MTSLRTAVAAVQHFIDAVIFDAVCLRIVADHIVVLVVPGQGPGTNAVALAVPFETRLFLDRPFKIPEGNLDIGGDGFVAVRGWCFFAGVCIAYRK